MLSGFSRFESTKRNLNWPGVSRAPTPASGGPRLPMKRTPVRGTSWHSRQFPSRPAMTSRPRAESPGVAVNAVSSASLADRTPAAHPATIAANATAATSRKLRGFRPTQISVSPLSASGRVRTGLPVAAKIAFSTAGTATQIVGSPTPPQKSCVGAITVSIVGICAMRAMP